MRYHSLVIDPKSLPAELTVSARTADGVIMAVRHKTFPVEGVQFHPESILAEEGKKLLKNFLDLLLKPLSMKLLCFQAKRFRWKTHSKTLAEVPGSRDRSGSHGNDGGFHPRRNRRRRGDRTTSVLRQSSNISNGSPTSAGLRISCCTLLPISAAKLPSPLSPNHLSLRLSTLARHRLSSFGHTLRLFLRMGLEVYGESLAKVWKEIR